MLELFNCRVCGGELKSESEDMFKCSCCGNVYIKKVEDSYWNQLKTALGEEKTESVSAARQNLWHAMHEEYIDSCSCLGYARELKALVPGDYFANFAEIANSKNEADISWFLNGSSIEDMKIYADAVLDFMLKSMTPGTLSSVCGYMDRAFEDKTSEDYVRWLNRYESEVEKVQGGIYELTIPRDVFIAYSSADMSKVLELCDFLEEQEITCFLAMRNLRHGRGAQENYDKAIKTAMDNCRIIVYASSVNSRKLGCDAYRIEIPYIRQKDLDSAPAAYRYGSYEKLPSKYKKNRIEYLLDDYKGVPTDRVVKEFFSGYEWCRTKEDVAERVISFLTSEQEPDVPSQPDTRGPAIDGENLQKIVAEAVAGAVAANPVKNATKETSNPGKEKSRQQLPEPSEGLEFTFAGGGYAVTGIGSCTDADVVVPSWYNKRTVTEVGNFAFRGCRSVTSVTILGGVLVIGRGAFLGCKSLASVTIPNTVTNIQVGAFTRCKPRAVFFLGAQADWKRILIGGHNNGLNKAKLYLYSVAKPSSRGRFWHYVDGKPVVW